MTEHKNSFSIYWDMLASSLLLEAVGVGWGGLQQGTVIGWEKKDSGKSSTCIGQYLFNGGEDEGRSEIWE